MPCTADDPALEYARMTEYRVDAGGTMPQPFRPGRQTLGMLLSQGYLVVPEWQRSYAWEKAQVEAFWSDINDFSDQYPGDNLRGQEYFLGSIVLVDETPYFQILDGQQRIATAAILLSVIRDSVSTFRQDSATRLEQEYLISYDDASDSSREHLTLNVYDRSYFRQYILIDRSSSWSEPATQYNSHANIKNARLLFEQLFAAKRATMPDNEAFFRWCLRIKQVVADYCSVVSVVSYDEDSAAAVFETLNDRGIGLSTADLLKNNLLRRARPEQREEINELWGEMLESAKDAEIKQFLRHYWISTHGDVKTQGLYKQIKQDIISEQLESITLTRRLKDAKDTYDNIVSAQGEDAELAELYKDISLLTAVVLYPAILVGVEVWSGNRDRLKRFVRVLINCFVRHNIVAGREASQLETVVYDLGRKLRENPDLDYQQRMQSIVIGDAEFEAAFEALTPRKTAWSRYLLATIEKFERPNEETLLGPSATLHVEHIYPQNPDSADRYVEHDLWVGRLGNLTLLGRRFNTQLRNAPFATKKLKYAESSIGMTKKLTAYDEWSPEIIQDRQASLAEKALIIWPAML